MDGVCDEIKESKAIKVYVCNVMTQPGETEGYTVYDHIRALEDHSYPGIVDFCIVNTADIPAELKKNYLDEGAELVKVDYAKIRKAGVNIIQGDFVSIRNNLVRHDANKLARVIIDLVADKVLAKDKKRTLDYYYIKDRLKSKSI